MYSTGSIPLGKRRFVFSLLRRSVRALKTTAWWPVFCCIVVAIGVAAYLNGSAQADEIAIAPPDSPHNGFAAELVLGWQFSPSQDIQVTALGWFDHEHDGFLNGRHEVGLFQTSDQSLLTSALISDASILEGDYRYEDVPATLLSAGEDYIVAGVDPAGPDDRYPVDATLANMNLHPLLDFQRTVFEEASSLVFPDDGFDDTGPWVVPANFQFVVVPEPVCIMLALAGVFGLVSMRRRRRLIGLDPA